MEILSLPPRIPCEFVKAFPRRKSTRGEKTIKLSHLAELRIREIEMDAVAWWAHANSKALFVTTLFMMAALPELPTALEIYVCGQEEEEDMVAEFIFNFCAEYQ